MVVFSIFDILTIPETWPEIICPPISSPKRAALSRLTKSDSSKFDKLVTLKVSIIISKARVFSFIEVTVKQTPSIETLAPILIPFTKSELASIRILEKSCDFSILETCAFSCIIPVSYTHLTLPTKA